MLTGGRGATISGLLVASLAFALAGCCGSGAAEAPDAGVKPEKAPDPAALRSLRRRPPQWTRQLPEKELKLRAGDRVWATIPRNGSEVAEMGVFRVVTAAKTSATLANKVGRKYERVPGVLIHSLGDPKALKVGDPALGQRWGSGRVLGRVASVRNGQVSMKYISGSKVIDAVMEHVEPLRTKVEPIAWVTFAHTSIRRGRALVVAVLDDWALIHTDNGRVKRMPLEELQLLRVGLRDFQVGDRVWAYRFAYGYEAGTILKIRQPKLLYQVQLGRRKGRRNVFFADMRLAEQPAGR